MNGSKRLAALFTLVSVLAAPAAALAQSERAVQGEDRFIYQHKGYVDFRDALLVEGILEGPSGDYVQIPSRPQFPLLIRVRKSFNRELRMSVDNL